MFAARVKYLQRGSGRADAGYVFREHGRSWSRLSPQERELCEERAKTVRDARIGEIGDEIAEAQDTLRSVMTQEREKPKYGAMLISTARWNQDDWQMLDALFLSDEVFSAKAVKGFRMEAIACPAPMNPELLTALRTVSLLDKEDMPQLCAMTVEIAKLRKLFACAVIEITADVGVRSYRFLNALLQPVHCALLPIAACTDDLGIGAVETKAEFEEVSAVESQCVWTYNWDTICTHDVLADVDETHVRVYAHSSFAAPGLLTTNAPSWSYREFCDTGREYMEGKGSKVEPERDPQPKSKRSRTEAPLWMSTLETMGSSSSTHPTASSSMADVTAETSEQDETGDDEAQDEMGLSAMALAEIEDHKAIAAESTWQVQRTSRAVYGHQSVIKRPSPMYDFASHFGLRLSAAFENNRYGQHMSPLLAQLWRTRMTRLYEYWRANDSPDNIAPGSVPSTSYTDELQNALNNANPSAVRRAEELSRMHP
eukprot:3805761-Amphidinium_carterae.2